MALKIQTIVPITTMKPPSWSTKTQKLSLKMKVPGDSKWPVYQQFGGHQQPLKGSRFPPSQKQHKDLQGMETSHIFLKDVSSTPSGVA